jgi:hypothetical protein
LVEQKLSRQKIAIDLFLLTGLILVTAAIATFYISNEKFFYYWDSANYSSKTSELVESFRASPLQAIKIFFKSLSDDYSQLPCLLLVPFIWFFGDSRLVYIVSSTLVYIIPFSLVMGMLATKIIPAHPRLVFWSTTFLTLLIPPTWISTLRGYPDIGAAVLIGLAILIFFKNINLKYWWQAPLIGILLALAILFRRHFAYSARAFLAAMILQGLIVFFAEIQKFPKKAFKDFCRYNIFVSLVAIASFVTLLLLAPTFVKTIITTNYRTLYSSYERPLIVSLQFYGRAYGWLTWILTILGFLTGILTRVLIRPASSFIISFGAISLIQWGLFSRQLGAHYTTHFLSFVVLGLVSLIWTIWLRFQEKQRLLILTFGILILATNAVIAITPIQISNNITSFLFAKNNPPLVRKDYDEFVRLINNLREIASDKQAIYVAASSRIINDSLTRAAEEQLYGKENKNLKIVDTPDIDSRDSYPLDEILQAQYVVIANPFQHHLPAKEQEIVKIIVDALTENWEIAQDFQRLPQQFKLDNNVLVSIYKRTRPTSVKTAFNTLKILQERIQPKPGSESNWIAIDKQNKGTIWLNKHGTINLKTIFREEPVTFIYFGSISEFVSINGNTRLSKCLGFTEFSLDLKLLDKTGNVIDTKNFIYSAQNPIVFPLSIQNEENKAAYLFLEFQGLNKSNDNSYCSVYLKDLAVNNAKEPK